MSDNDIPFIYNLFPSLVGDASRWLPHVERAANMGFNWLFLNPIHETGASGSLYAIKDYFKLNQSFFPQADASEQRASFKSFVADCRELGLEVMVDIVINHTAYDNPLSKQHRNWYVINDDGSLKSPGAVDDQAPGGYVVWGDLSQIDNENSPDKKNLHEYWWKVVEMFLDCGVRGFRCDAAYQIPAALWKMLIERSKSRAPETKFFAESLGCPLEDTLALAAAGHDFTFNSGKWWNYRDGWFLDQLRQMQGQTRSVCFPESHDTKRLAQEWNNDINRIKQHYLFTALISTGVLICIGFEYGFRRQPHVVESNPLSYEGAHFDITDFIREINAVKQANRVFQEDNQVREVDSGNDNVLALKKTTLDGKESVLMLFNRSGNEEQVRISSLLRSLGAPMLKPVPLPGSPAIPTTTKLRDWGVAILWL